MYRRLLGSNKVKYYNDKERKKDVKGETVHRWKEENTLDQQTNLKYYFTGGILLFYFLYATLNFGNEHACLYAVPFVEELDCFCSLVFPRENGLRSSNGTSRFYTTTTITKVMYSPFPPILDSLINKFCYALLLLFF